MTHMALLDSIPHRQKAADQRPWPRVIVGDDGWLAAIERLTSGEATLLGLLGEPAAVHMALLSADFREIAVVSLQCDDGTFISVAARHPPALRRPARRPLLGPAQSVAEPETPAPSWSAKRE